MADIEAVRAETQVPRDAPPLLIAGPFTTAEVIPTLIMIMVAVLTGLMNFYQKVKAGKARWLNITELIGELFTSAICGLLAYWLFKGFNINPYVTAAGVGMTGHMGSRALFMAEEAAARWMEQHFGINAGSNANHSSSEEPSQEARK